MAIRGLPRSGELQISVTNLAGSELGHTEGGVIQIDADCRRPRLVRGSFSGGFERVSQLDASTLMAVFRRGRPPPHGPRHGG